MNLVVRTEAENYKPVLTIVEVLERQDMIRQYAAAVMREGEDYGVIPGTGTRKVLLKPGAEKLVRIFGLTPRFTDVKIEEDWTGEAHGGEMFFAYTIKCSLYRNEVFMGDADGSCNSWEKKYRYSSRQRRCPVCGAEAIITGKREYGGGFICFDKKGGCKAKFGDNDPRITSQSTEQVADPDIADKVNTIRKMAEKRALVASCLITVGASEFFTQDMETPAPQERPQQASARPAPPHRQEEAYEAEYVPHPTQKSEVKAFAEGRFDQRPPNVDPDGVIHEGVPSRPPLSTLQQAVKDFKAAAGEIDGVFAAPSFTEMHMAAMVKCICVDEESTVEEVRKSIPSWEYATHILREFKDKHPACTASTAVLAIQATHGTKIPMAQFTDTMWQNPFPPAAGQSNSGRIDAATMFAAPETVEAR